MSHGASVFLPGDTISLAVDVVEDGVDLSSGTFAIFSGKALFNGVINLHLAHVGKLLSIESSIVVCIGIIEHLACPLHLGGSEVRVSSELVLLLKSGSSLLSSCRLDVVVDADFSLSVKSFNDCLREVRGRKCVRHIDD